MKRDLAIPDTVARFAASAYGQAGADWLRRLPTLVAECAEAWALRLGEPFSALSINFVVAASLADGTPVVLKVCFPSRELDTEIAALRLFDGRGSVRLLAHDEARGALLLERVQPGTPLGDVADDAPAMAAFASVVGRLHRSAPAEHSFPTFADWVGNMAERAPGLIGAGGSFPFAWVERALDLFAALERRRVATSIQAAGLQPAPPAPGLQSRDCSLTGTGGYVAPFPPRGRGVAGDGLVLLHGDLHQGNVLRAEREPWLAIDPKGVVGEPVWETGPLLLNVLPPVGDAAGMRAILARRVCLLADYLGVDRERIVAAGIVRAVLAAFWSVESEGDFWQGAIAVAERLSEIGGAHGCA